MSGKTFFALSLGFIAGSAAGVFASYKYFKKKYEKYANDEVSSVRKYYSEKYASEYYGEAKQSETKEKESNITQSKVESIKRATELNTSKTLYSNIIKELGYTSSSEKIEEDEKKGGPYVISPDSLGECDYDIRTLIYYNDEILAYAMSGKVIDNPPDIIGKEALGSFGKYDDDTVDVRDDANQIDYEIVRDARAYDDVYCIGSKPAKDE